MENLYDNLRKDISNKKTPLPANFWEGLENSIPTYEQKKSRWLPWLYQHKYLASTLAIAIIGIISITSYHSVVNVDNNQLYNEGIKTIETPKEKTFDQAIIPINQTSNLNNTAHPLKKPLIAQNQLLTENHSNQSFKNTAIGTLYNPQTTNIPTEKTEQLNTSIQNSNRNTQLLNCITTISPGIRSLNKLTFKSISKDNTTECPTFDKKQRNQFFAEIDGSGSYNIKNLSASNSTELNSLIRLRQETESKLISYGFGGNIGMIFGSGIVVKAGAHYHIIREYFDYYGDTTILLPNNTFQGVHIVKTTNTYKLIDLEIQAGYNKKLDKWNLEGSVGPIFNLNMKRKGNILNQQFKPDSISSGTPYGDKIFKQSLGLGLKISAGIYYNFMPETSLYLSADFRTYFTNWTVKEEYPIDTKYRHIVVNFGVRRFF